MATDKNLARIVQNIGALIKAISRLPSTRKARDYDQ